MTDNVHVIELLTKIFPRGTGAWVALAIAFGASHVCAGTLLNESFVGTGALAGSLPSTGPGTSWTTYYSGRSVQPSYQSDATGTGFPTVVLPADSMPVNAQRSASGTSFGAPSYSMIDGAFIGITPVNTGAIAATTAFTFANTSATNNPTDWAMLGLTTSLSNPDAFNFKTLGPWMIVRPALSLPGGTTVELYTVSGAGGSVTFNSRAASSTYLADSPSHTASIQYDPGLGTLNAVIDDVTLLSMPYQYGTSFPTINGVIVGCRSVQTPPYVTPQTPSATLFTALTVTQTPEPATTTGIAILSLCLLRRSRR